MEDKKQKTSIFKRLKHWWKEELTEDDRDIFKIAGIWCLDGALWGTIITAGVKNNQAKKIRNQALATGYIQGQMDAYKEIAQNPYKTIDKAISLGEKNGTVKRINF